MGALAPEGSMSYDECAPQFCSARQHSRTHQQLASNGWRIRALAPEGSTHMMSVPLSSAVHINTAELTIN